MTKSNLQIAGSSFDDYLEFLIDAAQNAIKADLLPVPEARRRRSCNAAHAAVCAQQQGIRRKGEGGRGR